MINTIHIKRLALYGHHGVMPQEKVVGAMFYVSLEIKCEVAKEAYLHDELDGTVSYADIIDHVRKEMNTPSALLENLAYRIGKTLIDAFSRIQCINVRIDKENPPCGVSAESIGVECEIHRDA
jgi:dihydroneopterin aldolase